MEKRLYENISKRSIFKMRREKDTYLTSKKFVCLVHTPVNVPL